MTPEVKKEYDEMMKKRGWKRMNDFRWYEVFQCQEFTESFIKEVNDQIDWCYLSCHKYFSEDFMRKFKDYVRWDNISYQQTLSEDFIIEFKDKVVWHCITRNQKISPLFIYKFRDRLDIKLLILRGSITQEYLDQMTKPVKQSETRRLELMDI